MATATQLPNIPEINLTIPPSQLAAKAFAYAKQHCDEAVYNHAIRAAYWALIIAKKLPEFHDVNLDIVLVGCTLHDMGWARTEVLLSYDKRFEVDSANIARDFIRDTEEAWDESKIQRVWDAIALHTTSSIARYAASEVALTNLGVVADFLGPSLPGGPGGENLITDEEYHAVMKVFPRAGFNSEGLKRIACWLCRTKPDTTYDNWVGGYGREFGTDGNGAGKEEYARVWEEKQSVAVLSLRLDALEALDEMYSSQR